MCRLLIKAFLCFVFILFCGNSFGENLNEAYKKALAKYTLDREVVKTTLEGFDNNILKGNSKGEPILSSSYYSFAGTVKMWMNCPDYELKTDIDSSWYVKLYKTFEYMAKIKRYLENAQLDKKQNTAEYKAETAKFLKAYNYFKQLQKDPTKIDPKKLKELKRLKREREKAERAKGQID